MTSHRIPPRHAGAGLATASVCPVLETLSASAIFTNSYGGIAPGRELRPSLRALLI